MPLSGVGDAAFGGSGRVGPASRTFWVSRLLRGILFRALLKWIIAIVPSKLLTARLQVEEGEAVACTAESLYKFHTSKASSKYFFIF